MSKIEVEALAKLAHATLRGHRRRRLEDLTMPSPATLGWEDLTDQERNDYRELVRRIVGAVVAVAA